MEEDEQILKLISEEKIEIKGVSVGTQFRLLRRIENLINKYKEQEKMIYLMSYRLNEYANLGELIDCPAEYDGIKDLRSCPRDKNCIKCIIEHFRKKAKGENK